MDENNTNDFDAKHYITFKLDGEMFATCVTQVREVLALTQITRVPTAPHYMRGVVNVRGVAIPVVDLRSKFGMTSQQDTFNTRILVMELELDGEITVVGGLADSVHNVIEIDSSKIGPPPKIASGWRTDLIQGMARLEDEFIMVLDIDRVFSVSELSRAAETSDTTPVEKELAH